MNLVYVSKCAPRIIVQARWGCERPPGEIAMYVARVGDPGPFAAYTPLEESGEFLTFELDDLMFMRRAGRFEGDVHVGGMYFFTVNIQYENGVTFVKAENPDHV